MSHYGHSRPSQRAVMVQQGHPRHSQREAATYYFPLMHNVNEMAAHYWHQRLLGFMAMLATKIRPPSLPP